MRHKNLIIEVLAHLLLLAICLLLLNNPYINAYHLFYPNSPQITFAHQVIGWSINCLLFYGNSFYLIPRFFKPSEKYTYPILLSISFIFLCELEIAFDHYFIGKMESDSTIVHSFSSMLVWTIVTNALMVLLSFAYCFVRNWFLYDQLIHALKEQKLTAELEVIKSQVNPHFLFNTLNNLFGLAIQQRDETTASGIQKLAGLIRYSLTDCKREKIELLKEINYISDYIELQRMRLIHEKKSAISFTVQGDARSIYIAPMLFIPFIENAFRQSVSLSVTSPIKINFLLSDEDIVFTLIHPYTSDTEPDRDHGNFGIENVKQRLELLYTQLHLLKIEKTNGFLHLKLTIYHKVSFEKKVTPHRLLAFS